MFKWEGSFTVTKMPKKMTSVTDGTELKTFNMSSVVPIAPKWNDTYFKYDIGNVQTYASFNNQLECPVELPKPSDPKTRWKYAILHFKTRLVGNFKEEHLNMWTEKGYQKTKRS